MKNSVFFIILAIIGYLIGSLNFSIILSGNRKDDVRKYGSGNAGATNMLRTYGPKMGLITFALDGLKTVLTFVIGYYSSILVWGTTNRYAAIFAATFCLIGHCFPLYFGFKGGKGVTTTGVLFLLIDLPLALAAFAVFILVVIITKYVGLGAMLGALSFSVFVMIFRGNVPLFVYALALTGFIIFMHRKNIERMLNKTESKFSFSKKK